MVSKNCVKYAAASMFLQKFLVLNFIGELYSLARFIAILAKLYDACTF